MRIEKKKPKKSKIRNGRADAFCEQRPHFRAASSLLSRKGSHKFGQAFVKSPLKLGTLLAGYIRGTFSRKKRE
jgi:hypothetical protein